MNTSPTEDLLHAYADDQLSPEAAAPIRVWLDANPAWADEIEHWRRQNIGLKALFDSAALEQVPARLSPRRVAARHHSVRYRNIGMAAAAVVLIAFGGLLGWFAAIQVGPDISQEGLIIEARQAHQIYAAERRHAVEVDESERDHLLNWLSARLEFPLDAPDLSAEGFRLLGGRLLPGPETGAAAQLMYESDIGERVTIYVARGEDLPAQYAWDRTGNTLAVYWSDDTIECAVIGSLPEERMRPLAHSAYEQLVATSGT